MTRNYLSFYSTDKARALTATAQKILAASPVPQAFGVITDSIGSGTKLAHGALEGAHITLGGVRLEINSHEMADLAYNALVPKVAQAFLKGELPSADDFEHDAIAMVGGPIEGIYVAANSVSAEMIQRGEVPPIEQIGRDMIAALTPVALRRLGL